MQAGRGGLPLGLTAVRIIILHGAPLDSGVGTRVQECCLHIKAIPSVFVPAHAFPLITRDPKIFQNGVQPGMKLNESLICIATERVYPESWKAGKLFWLFKRKQKRLWRYSIYLKRGGGKGTQMED